MENLTRKLAEIQLTLMNEVRVNANINIVNCGHCDTLLLHKRKEESIVCWGCLRDMNLSDCIDLWYEGCLENEEFNKK